MEQQFQVLHIEKRSIVSFGEERHIERGVSKISEEVVEEVEEEISEKEGENDEVFSEPGEKKNRYNRKKGYIEKEVFLPDNADPDRTHLNRELIERPTEKNDAGIEVPLTISQTIMRRIEKATGKKKVPKDRNIAMELILTGSPDTMNAMDLDTLENWCHDSIQWAKDNFGEENVVSAVLHRDEKTPHIHMFVVPIVNGPSRSTLRKRWKRQQECIKKGLKYKEYKDDNKPRLCVDDLMGSEAFYKYHDSYSAVVEKYGLQRGMKAEKGSKKKHQTSEEYNRDLANKAKEQEGLIKEQSNEISRLKSDLEIAKVELTLTKEKNQELQANNESKEKENDTLRNLNREQEKKYNDLENKYGELDKEYKDKLENLNYQIVTQDTLETIPEIAMGVLRKIVDEDMGCFLAYYEKKENGDYHLDIAIHGATNRYKVDGKTGNVFALRFKGQGWDLLPEASGKRFLAFFKTVKNETFYKQLSKKLEDEVTIRARVNGQASASTAPSQIGRGGHGGGGHRQDEPKRPANFNLGHGGWINTQGASSSGKGESLYDEAVRKGEEERQKRRGPSF